MNRDEIAAKIAELEKKIQIDKMQETSSPHTSDSTSNSGNDRYALCLGGGGGKGAYQLGVYRALTEYGLMKKVDAISGTSIGAINAVLFACNDPDRCDDAWRQIHFETVFDVDSDLLFNDKLGFLSRKEMLKLMGSYLDYDKLSSGIPKIYATIAECVQDEPKNAEYIDLSGKNKEEINTVVMASSTLPLLYESVTYNDKEYCDGGLADNVPVKPLYDIGYRHIVVCGLNADSKKELSEYPDADFIEIYPSVSLGDLIDGTLNFSANSVKFRSMLGYRDTIRALKVHFEHDPDYIAAIDHYRDIDLADIKTQMSMDAADSNVKNTIDDIGRILGKLGIDE